MKEHNLISRLKSVKRFFLLDQGDFLNQFIDLADDELKMPVSDITSSRLEALLEISIRTSAADKDPYKDDLKVVLSDKDLITQECYSQNVKFPPLVNPYCNQIKVNERHFNRIERRRDPKKTESKRSRFIWSGSPFI